MKNVGIFDRSCEYIATNRIHRPGGFYWRGRQLFVTNMPFAQANSSISNLSLTVKRFADVNRDLRISIPLRRKFG